MGFDVKVVSSFAPYAGDRVMVFDTVVDGGGLVVAVVESPDLGGRISADGARTIRAFAAHHRSQHPNGATHLVHVEAAATAGERVMRLLRATAAGGPVGVGDAILFIGRDGACCQHVLNALGFKGRGRATLQ